MAENIPKIGYSLEARHTCPSLQKERRFIRLPVVVPNEDEKTHQQSPLVRCQVRKRFLRGFGFHRWGS